MDDIKEGSDIVPHTPPAALAANNVPGGISFADEKHPLSQVAGLEIKRELTLRRELTKDEKELANAGYEELEANKKAKALEGRSGDIVESFYSFIRFLFYHRPTTHIIIDCHGSDHLLD